MRIRIDTLRVNERERKKIIIKIEKKSIYEWNKTGDTFYYMRSDAFVMHLYYLMFAP
jgi:hypothetical protein